MKKIILEKKVDVYVNARIGVDEFLCELSPDEKLELYKALGNMLKDVRVDFDEQHHVLERDPELAVDDIAEREITERLERFKDYRPPYVLKRILCNVFRLGYYENERLREELETIITAP